MLRKPTRRFWMLLAAVAVAALVIARAGARDRAPAIWARAEPRALHLEAPFTGRLRALQVAEYGAPTGLPRTWEYRIAFLAPEGSVVAAGEPVLRFDTSELEESLRRYTADRDAAQKELEQRRMDFEAEVSEQGLALEEARTQERRAQVTTDVPEDLVARSTLEKAAVDLELARGEVEHRQQRIAYLEDRRRTELALLQDRRDRAAAAVAETERWVGLMTVRATSPGTVSHRPNRRGEKKKVGDSSWRGERLVEIPEPGALRIDAWVKEADAGALRVGMPATLRLEAHPDRALRARVESIRQAVERRTELDAEPIVRLELSFEQADPELVRPGLRVQGTVRIEERPPSLAIPVAAVAPGDRGPVVTVATWLGRAQRSVELGRRSGGWVEVVAGLEEGERVLLPS